MGDEIGELTGDIEKATGGTALFNKPDILEQAKTNPSGFIKEVESEMHTFINTMKKDRNIVKQTKADTKFMEEMKNVERLQRQGRISSGELLDKLEAISNRYRNSTKNYFATVPGKKAAMTAGATGALSAAALSEVQ